MPTAAAPKPKCHELSGDRPNDASTCLNPSPCASQPVMSGAMNAPVLMPM